MFLDIIIVFLFFIISHNNLDYSRLVVLCSVQCRPVSKLMREQHLLIARQPANQHKLSESEFTEF